MWSANGGPPTGDVPARRRRRTGSRDALKTSLSIPSLSRNDSSHSDLASTDPHATPDIDYMEPAIEGPPSPERLRQLSKQMKRASYLNRPRISRQESSGSSPRRAMERAPWETAMDSLTLARHPSSRSNSSGTPSKERPERESIQILGRQIFQRPSTKSKRASSSHSSSNSSLYSGELPGETAIKDSFMPMPSLFARRKPSRDDTIQKRLQISGPFNFQHVTHTQRENLFDFQARDSRLDLASEMSTLGTPGPATAPGALKIAAHDLHQFKDEATDAFEATYGNAPLTAPPSRPSLAPRHTAPVVVSRPAMRSAKSQEMLRSTGSLSRSSPRSQSPTETGDSDLTNCGPVPPPRFSSRQSSFIPDGFGSAFGPASPLERPRTSGGFRQPQPFDPSGSGSAGEALPLPASPAIPPATSHGYLPSSDFEAFGVDEKRFSHAITTPNESAWPLTSTTPTPPQFDKALPDVPEEEEHAIYNHGGRSRVSVTSNNSSLRGSHSVPALRFLSQAQRSMSETSDTLGQDIAATQRALKAARHEPQHVEESSVMDDDWEDVIDYCYEHEAEANFNYQWENPPLEAALADDELAEVTQSQAPQTSPHPSHNTQASSVDLTARSPTHQRNQSSSSRRSPNNRQSTVLSNFSLPRGEKGSRISQLKGVRPISYASSFRESQGFNLSPSLLIPGDFHQQMLAEKYDYHDDEIVQGPFYDELVATADGGSLLPCQQRSSTSTTGSNLTSNTDSTGERHASANSTFTAMTRLTLSSSSTSLNKAAGIAAEPTEPLPTSTTTQIIDVKNMDDEFDEESTPPATQDKVPELTPFPVTQFGRKTLHRPHASESVLREEIAPLRSQDWAKMRRPRARTSSLSAQIAPPVGQYALFPRSHVKGTGDKI